MKTAPTFRPRRAQRGVVMFVAMAVLIVMTLAGLAMLRQMGSSTAIAGNLAFKRSATSSADLGIESARTWLTTNTASLNDNATVAVGGAYFATWGGTSGTGVLLANEVDPSRGNWTDVWKTITPVQEGVTLDKVRWIVQRLCKNVGAADAAGQDCAAAPGVNPSKGGPSGTKQPTPAPSPYYRVTTQVQGARNTVSYTQVVLGS